MDDLGEYNRLVSEAQAIIKDLNAKLAVANTLSNLWAGANLQVTEAYRKLAEKTKILNEMCE
jgi:hypothetical protein